VKITSPAPTKAERDAGVLLVGGLPTWVHPRVAVPFRVFSMRLAAARIRDGKSALISSGGYNFRPVRGYEAKWAATRNPRWLSNHSWGLAVDYCAPTNPMGSPLRTDMPADTGALAAACGLTHGAEWSRPDPMHLEFLSTPAQADDWTRRLLTPQPVLLHGEETLMNAAQEAKLDLVNAKLDWVLGQFGYVDGKWTGVDTWDGSKRKLTLLDLLRESHRELNQRLPGRDPQAPTSDTLLGHVLNVARDGAKLVRKVGA